MSYVIADVLVWWSGPLVRASLKASVTAKRKVRVYAVEKNPNAVITLRNLGTHHGLAPRNTSVRGVGPAAMREGHER